MTDQKQSSDSTIDGALDTLRRLDGLGEYAYTANAAVLITEAHARAAVADAVTNRIRLLQDLIRDAVPHSPHMDRLNRERLRLIGSITEEAPHAEA